MSLSLDTAGRIVFQNSGTANGNTCALVAPISMAANQIITLPDVGADSHLVLDQGAQTIAGAKTFSSQIIASAGVTAPMASGYVVSGAVAPAPVAAGGTLAAIAAGSRTLASKMGTLKYTGITSIAANGSDTLTIVNANAGSAGLVTMELPTIAQSSALTIISVTWTANTSIAILVSNLSAATATGAFDAHFNFISFN